MFTIESFTAAKSIEILKETEQYLESSGKLDDTRRLMTAYFPVQRLIPIPLEAMLSGTLFPWMESHNDFQISSVLASFGLYKPACASLRSALELALLSVYWNIEDDGHVVIQDWARSRDATPFASKVWKRISRHPNFAAVEGSLGLNERFESLRGLHDYVHTRGIKYSNSLPLGHGLRSMVGTQGFSEEAYESWLELFAEVLRFSAVCHLVRYPLGTVRLDWGSKFGLDIPDCGVLESHEVDQIEKLVTPPIFKVIAPLAETDPHARGILDWVKDKPDITKEEFDQQLVEQALLFVRGMGFSKWARQQRDMVELCRQKGDESSVEAWEDFIARVAERAEQEGTLSLPGLLRPPKRKPAN